MYKTNLLWFIVSIFFYLRFISRKKISRSFLERSQNQDWYQEDRAFRNIISIQFYCVLQEEGKCTECSKAWALKWERPEHESQHCHFQVVRPWASYLTSLCLGFISYKMQVRDQYLLHQVSVRVKWDNTRKMLSSMPGTWYALYKC